MTNEAAERLREQWEPHERVLFGTLFDAALEIERRATVRRIRAAMQDRRILRLDGEKRAQYRHVMDILDAEEHPMTEISPR